MTSHCNIIKATVVRFVLIFHALLTTWRVTVNLENKSYWLLLGILLPFFCESYYTIFKRHGREFSRFTPCFFFYLGVVLPGIWLLELNRTERYIDGKPHLALSMDPTNISVPGISQGIWLIVIEEMMPYVIFISRWILPRGTVTREELAELLFSFIEIGADIMEFFALFDEDVVRRSKRLSFAILSIWSVSVLQFTMTFTVIHQPKSDSTIRVIHDEPDDAKERRKMKYEIRAIFLTLSMQDLPFAIMRLYTIINFNRISYSLIFFTSKNLLIIALLLYKVAVLCNKRHCPDQEDDDGGEKVIGEGLGLHEAKHESVPGKHNFAGNLSHFSPNNHKPTVFLWDTDVPQSHYIADNESGLKKRKSKFNNRSPELNNQSSEFNRRSPYLNRNDDFVNVNEGNFLAPSKPRKRAKTSPQNSDFAHAKFQNFNFPDPRLHLSPYNFIDTRTHVPSTYLPGENISKSASRNFYNIHEKAYKSKKEYDRQRKRINKRPNPSGGQFFQHGSNLSHLAFDSQYRTTPLGAQEDNSGSDHVRELKIKNNYNHKPKPNSDKSWLKYP